MAREFRLGQKTGSGWISLICRMRNAVEGREAVRASAHLLSRTPAGPVSRFREPVAQNHSGRGPSEHYRQFASTTPGGLGSTALLNGMQDLLHDHDGGGDHQNRPVRPPPTNGKKRPGNCSQLKKRPKKRQPHTEKSRSRRTGKWRPWAGQQGPAGIAGAPPNAAAAAGDMPLHQPECQDDQGYPEVGTLTPL